MKLFCLFSAFSLLLVALNGSAKPHFAITQIAGDTEANSYAYSVNEDGEVVGRQGRKAFHWRDGALELLESHSETPAYQSYGLAINNAGFVVGGRRANSELQGFYLGGQHEGLIPVTGRSYAEVRDINNRNQALIVIDEKVFIRDLISENQRRINIKTASAMNDVGALAGLGEIYDDGASQPIGDLGVEKSTHAKDINNRNVVVGYSDYRRGYHHAFIWRSERGIESLGTLGGKTSAANAINNRNWVVGWSATDNGEYRATLWRGHQKAMDLTNMVVDLRGWRYLSEARDINEAGQVVGFGIAADGRERAFLLTPLNPP